MHSPTRRVLGAKDANTHLKTRPAHNATASEILTIAIDGPKLSRVPGGAPLHTTTTTGHKRKIDDVEDAERVEHNRLDNSQSTLLLDESDSEVENEEVSMSTFQRSYETAGTSFVGSQNMVEQQFELQQDEMSQRTLDKLNAVPLPQNTSQLPPWQPALLNDLSAGSVGLSTFFNLDDQASTQGSDSLQMLEPVDKAQANVTHKGKEDSKHQTGQSDKSKDQAVTSDPKVTITSQNSVLPSIIEAAKTRLQLAMYKVHTKQIHKPFSRLKREPLPAPSLLGTPRLAQPREPTTTAQSISSDATITLESFNRDSFHSRENEEANNTTIENQDYESDPDQTRLQRRSESVVADSCKGSQSTTNLGTQHFLSSPPLSRQHSTDSLEELLPPNDVAGTSQANSHESGKQSSSQQHSSQPQQQQQLSSPPISDSGRARSVNVKAQQIGKGEAATGLLQLMTGGAGLCGV